MNFKSGSTLSATSAGQTNIKAGGNILQTGAKIHLNGPSAVDAEVAEKAVDAKEPGIVPTHEPWYRPRSKMNRNKFWRP
jgi:hypothetical protein